MNNITYILIGCITITYRDSLNEEYPRSTNSGIRIQSSQQRTRTLMQIPLGPAPVVVSVLLEVGVAPALPNE